MPSVDDEANKDHAVESYLSAGKLAVLLAGLDESVVSVFSRMADTRVDREVQVEAARQLSLRGLSLAVKVQLKQRYGF